MDSRDLEDELSLPMSRFDLEERRLFEKIFGAEEDLRIREAAREQMFWNGDEYVLQEEEEEPDFLVDGFLPYGYLAVLGGTSKSGKTCLATALAIAVSKGEPFLGMPTRQSAVLWCAYEESRFERLLVLREYEDVPACFHVTHDRPAIDNPDDVENLRWWIDKTEAKLIVIDPLFGATRGSLADGRTARDAMMRLKCLCFETGAAALVVHHFNKEASVGLTRERFAESNQILATASMDLLMDTRGTADGAREIRLMGRGRGNFANRTWLLRSEGPAHFELVGDRESGVSMTRVKSAAILSALAAASGPLTSDEIATACGLYLPTLRNLVAQMLKDGEIAVARKEGKSRRFSLP